MKQQHETDEKKAVRRLEEDEWRELLSHYTVEYPDESRVETTIDRMQAFVPAKRKRGRRFYPPFQMTGDKWLNISPIYWGASLVLFVLGFLIVIAGEMNAYLTAMAMAPVPFVLGMVEVFKSWQQNMNELEMTTKFSLEQIVLSKMVLVGGFSLFLNVLATLAVPVFSDGIRLWKLVLYWFTPFTLIAAVTFVIAGKVRNGYLTAAISLAIWAGAAYGITVTELAHPWLEQVHVIFYLVLNALAVAELFRRMRRFCHRGRNTVYSLTGPS